MDAPCGFKGNKQALPRKRCAGCGREMTWRRRWTRTWEAVRWCSERCRQQRPGGGHG